MTFHFLMHFGGFYAVWQESISYFTLYDKSLYHILRCMTRVYIIFYAVLQESISYFTLYDKSLYHIF